MANPPVIPVFIPHVRPPHDQATADRQLAYMDALFADEHMGALNHVAIGPYSVLMVILYLQVTVRIPGLPALVTSALAPIIDHLASLFTGTPAAQIIAQNGNPELSAKLAMPGGGGFRTWLRHTYPDGSGPVKDLFTADDMAAAYLAGRTFESAQYRDTPLDDQRIYHGFNQWYDAANYGPPYHQDDMQEAWEAACRWARRQ